MCVEAFVEGDAHLVAGAAKRFQDEIEIRQRDEDLVALSRRDAPGAALPGLDMAFRFLVDARQAGEQRILRQQVRLRRARNPRPFHRTALSSVSYMLLTVDMICAADE